jgi:hypothetical protein
MSAQRSSSRIGLAMSFRRRNNDKVNRNDRELTAPKHHFVKASKSLSWVTKQNWSYANDLPWPVRSIMFPAIPKSVDAG